MDELRMEAKRDKRASSIRAAAARHFMLSGYTATSMDDIAESVGVTKGALYYYFPSKSDLLHQIYSSVIDEISGRIATQPPSKDAAEQLHTTFRSILSVVEDMPMELGVYLQEGPLLEQFLTRDQVRSLRRREEAFADQFHDLIETGITDKAFRPVDTQVVALALIGMASWTRRWYRAPGRLTVDDVAGVFADLVLQGLVVRDTPGETT